MTKLTPEEVLKQSFDCCRQIVKSYGPNDLSQHIRDNLCGMMDHYQRVAKVSDNERCDEWLWVLKYLLLTTIPFGIGFWFRGIVF